MKYPERRVGPLKNPYERQLYDELTAQGWDVTKRGWPDFACFKGDNLALVEVKSGGNRHLKREQYRLMAALAKLGVRCFRWSSDGGFQPVTPAVRDISPRQERKLHAELGGDVKGEGRRQAKTLRR